jgi:hypothetical protein
MLGKINFWAVAGIGDPGYSFFGKVTVTVVPRFTSLSILADPP